MVAFAFFIADALDKKDGVGPVLSSYVTKNAHVALFLTKSTDYLTFGYLMFEFLTTIVNFDPDNGVIIILKFINNSNDYT